MLNVPNNKLIILLIKDNLKIHNEILKDIDSYQKVEINKDSTLYYEKSYKNRPKWIKQFFDDKIEHPNELFSSIVKAVLIINVEINKNETKIFALTFGYGRLMLKTDVYEEKFGLVTTMNTIDAKQIRRIDKRNFSSIQKLLAEQLTNLGSSNDFEFDNKQDIIQSITGKTKNSNFGNTVSGKDSLSISSKINIKNINEFLKEVYKNYKSKSYLDDFDFNNNIEQVKDKILIQKLNDELINKIKSNNLDKVWLSIPEIIDWSDIKGFSFQKNSKSEFLLDDITFESFKEYLISVNKNFDIINDINYFKKEKVYLFSSSNDTFISKWSLYQCLYAEINLNSNDNVYMLSEKNWFQIKKDFALEINDSFELIIKETPFSLPDCNKLNENKYNEHVPLIDNNITCLDKKLIRFGNSKSSIEFCDLFTKSKHIIHVKKYGYSAVLSHLFAQGLVSGKLFLKDQSFREKVNKILPDDFKITNTSEKPLPNEYNIIYAIIKKKSKKFDIPFFSKVNLIETKDLLESFGYKVSLVQINDI